VLRLLLPGTVVTYFVTGSRAAALLDSGSRCSSSAAPCARHAPSGCLHSGIRHDERHERSIQVVRRAQVPVGVGPANGPLIRMTGRSTILEGHGYGPGAAPGSNSPTKPWPRSRRAGASSTHWPGTAGRITGCLPGSGLLPPSTSPLSVGFSFSVAWSAATPRARARRWSGRSSAR